MPNDSLKFTLPLALKVALIVVAGLAIYAPVFHGAWLMDDDLYLPNNPLRHDPARLWKIWFEPGQFIEYYPISETLQMLQWKLWGSDTLGYHLTNVLLHIASGLLLWRLLARLGLKLAWIGGLLFVVHPANVESVAWISEFKNALSMPLFLLSATAWIDFENRKQPRDYWLAFALFLAAMLCKISMAPFPFVIFLYAWWKRGKVKAGDFVGSIPFFVVSMVLGAATISAGGWFRAVHHSPPELVPTGGIFWRLDLAGLTLASYFTRVFWPLPLDPMVPPWPIDPADPRQWLPWLVIVGGLVWFWTRRATWGRHALLGGGFFVLMIAPFLGFVPASYLQNSFIFDHFLYLPMIGLIALMIAAAEDLVRRMPRERHWLLTLMLMPIAYFAAESWLYAPTFARPSVFFGAVVRNHPQWWSAHNSLGNALRKEGHPDGALAEFRLASGLAPDRAEPLNNLGALLFEMHRYAEAVEPYEQAIALDPNDAETQTGLGNVYLLIGKLPDAIAEYEAAVKIRPDDAQAHNGLATALMNSGRMPEAQAQVEEAVKLEPDYMQAHATLGLIFAQEGRNDEAIAQFERAQVLAPDDPRIERELEALRVQHVGK